VRTVNAATVGVLTDSVSSAVSRWTETRGRTRLASLALLTAAYFIAGKIGLSLAYVNESTSAVWPPAGIAVAALLQLGLAAWPAVALGAFLVNVTTSGSVLASLAIAAGNTLEALAAAWLVARFARGRAAFERTGDILRFAALAAFVATAIAASVGTLTLMAADLARPRDAAFIWLTWWLGDAAGVLVVAPLLLLWSTPARGAWTPARLAEAAALAVCLVTAALVTFTASPVGVQHLQVQFVTIPLLLWAAFRFGGRETAIAAATLSIVVIYGTVSGFGPFARPSPNESLLVALGFAGVITIVMLSVAAEVTTRVQVEGAMRRLNQELEQRVAARTSELARIQGHLLDAQQMAHIGSWEWEIGSDRLWWSDEMCRLYGLPEGAPPSYEAFLAYVHPVDRAAVHDAVTRALADSRPFTFDHRIVRADGTIRTLHAQGRVVLGGDRQPVRMLGTGHDITDRLAAEEQRAQLLVEQAARHDAEQVSRAKDQFLAVLSHELRTPLNVALGTAHRLRQSSPESSAALVDKLYRNLEMLSKLVADILDVSRITAGFYVLETGPVSLRAVAEAAVDAVREAADRRRIRIETRMAELPLLQGDARRLEQVASNLLSNAVKFAPEGGRVVVSLAREAGAVTLAVEDDGPGIAPAFLPHVFEEFRQADSSITREHGGLGLGLAIAKRLVQLHGGVITAANREGGGAVFTVSLPAPDGAPGLPAPAPPGAAARA